MSNKISLKQKTQSDIEHLEKRYDGDNDIIPGAPVVTYADFELLAIVKKLIERIDEQQEEINALKDQFQKHTKSPYLH